MTATTTTEALRKEEQQLSPDWVRISMAAAIELGLKPGKIHGCGCGCINLLQNYPQRMRHSSVTRSADRAPSMEISVRLASFSTSPLASISKIQLSQPSSAGEDVGAASSSSQLSPRALCTGTRRALTSRRSCAAPENRWQSLVNRGCRAVPFISRREGRWQIRRYGHGGRHGLGRRASNWNGRLVAMLTIPNADVAAHDCWVAE